MAIFTQSTGVPLQLYSVAREPKFNACMRSVELMVIACPMPDCGRSGATTNTSPSSLTIEIKVRIPGAFIPSSLVTKIKGDFDFKGLLN